MYIPNGRYLTKSRFQLALSCPSKLFYTGKPAYANTMADNDFMAMLADGGFQVGALAKLMYPQGMEITATGNAQALEDTAAVLLQEDAVLFEPAIAYEGLLVRVDILVKRGRTFQVIEVKAKSYDGDIASLSGKRKAIASGIRSYVQDVAFQKYVIQRAFPGYSVSAHLLMPDKSKHTPVNGLNQWFKVRRDGRNTQVLVDARARAPGLAESVLTCVGVDHLADVVLTQPIDFPGGPALIGEAASRWARQYQDDKRIAPVIGAHCGSCEFKAVPGTGLNSGFHECWKTANNWSDADFADGTVLDLWNFRGKKKLIPQGVVKLRQVTTDDIGLADEDEWGTLTNAQRQWLQIVGLPPEHAANGFYLDREGLAHAMRAWKFPLHMIDFETAAVALPFHAGRRPYEQVAFQFSHHVLTADGTVTHQTEFLCCAPGEFPNYQFVRALRVALSGDDGTIFRWSHHENSILKAIKFQLTASLEHGDAGIEDAHELIAFIDEITREGPREMVDLAVLARKHYFHPSTKGSCSIKKVLPAVMQSSAFLAERYGRPTYGAVGGIVSRNFQGMAWFQRAADGSVADPYQLLIDRLDEDAVAEYDEDSDGINQGGAASYAYLRLQFEDLVAAERARLEKALLRYCELDTLAMVLVLQAWMNA